MAAEDEQANDDGEFWFRALLSFGATLLVAISVVGSFASPIAAVIDLIAGPVRPNHAFLHWWVSPSQGWLVLRAGWYATTILFVAIWWPGISRLLGGVDDNYLPPILNQLVIFGWFLFTVLVLVCLFAATDLQGAYDHAAGPSQCFAAAPSGATGSVPGVLSSSDAIYFAIGNLTTAGTGQVAPLSSGCRALIAWQTAIGAVVILFGVGGVLTQILREDAWRSGTAESSGENEARSGA